MAPARCALAIKWHEPIWANLLRLRPRPLIPGIAAVAPDVPPVLFRANNRHLRLEEVELGCILNYFHTAVPLCATALKKSLTAVHL
jgi:hypothetical protein